MEEKKFNYKKAEADLDSMGCHDSEDIYSYRSEKGINGFMRENGLNPNKYYENSSNSNSSSSSSSGSGPEGCYLTTACLKARKMGDDCSDLMILRNYRDTYLVNKEGGKKDIAYYYKTAPKIVEAINCQQDASSIWESMYETLVSPCVNLIQQGQLEKAYEVYRNYTLKLAENYL